MAESRLLTEYARLVANGELRADPAQRTTVEQLAGLAAKLEKKHERRRSFASRLDGWLGRRKPEPPQSHGIYLWGAVGRGKSMLMDLFYQNVAVEPRLRVHFHEFMLETHHRIHLKRKESAQDPIPAVAAEWVAEAHLLAFDEMQVNNIADAMILSRLFTALLEQGVTVVITSNRHPTDLYKDGLSRELFLPFIDLLLRDLAVISLNGPTDYRLDRIGGMDSYYVPNGPEATSALEKLFFRMTDFAVADRDHVPSEELPIGDGRILHVPKALKGVAVFSFKRLCREARGASDYLAIARRYHTVILVGVPKMSPEKRNEASRFVTLIDALYEWNVKLFMAADAPPQELYPSGDGSFEFERTVSRLMEMQSAEYMAEGHGIRPEEEVGAGVS